MSQLDKTFDSKCDNLTALSSISYGWTKGKQSNICHRFIPVNKKLHQLRQDLDIFHIFAVPLASSF